jgi:hypothetical protein
MLTRSCISASRLDTWRFVPHSCADAVPLGAVATYGKDDLEVLTGMGPKTVAALGPALE